MGEDSARKVPDERAATAAEIEAAIDSLSESDLLRLREFAENRQFFLQERAQGRDLLGEAFERLLRGSRRWDKTKAGFLAFMFSTMRSIANSWFREKASPTKAPLPAASLVVENEDGQVTDPVENFSLPEADTSQLLVYRETLEMIDALFVDAEEESMVLEGFRDGLEPAAIRELWGFSQPQYNAIILRMRRKLKRTGIADPRGVSQSVQ